MSESEDPASLEAQQSLLYAARHGDSAVVRSLLEAKNDGKINLLLDCKGTTTILLGLPINNQL